ncbi:LBBP_01157 family protein [Leptospira sp. 'Mane']|uniref:LBBP_01157 family protein n=1 Tax=Leptospira sp. 'Mane' TaxID=3387407 RepID=UPI00398A7AAB
MAKKNKPSFWSRIISSLFGSESKIDAAPVRKKEPQHFNIEWKIAHDKYKDLLLTKQVETGLVVERKGYKLNKTNDKLFRLEGENFSVIIATGNSLYPNKEGKMTGILFVDEGELNQAVQIDFSQLDGFLDRVSIPKTDVGVLSHSAKPKDWKVILTWELFWKEQLLLQISPNNMALIILTLGEEGRKFFESIATERQKKLVRDEFFFLNQGKTSSTDNPHGKNKNLFGFGAAMKEFSEKIIFVQTKMEKENES